MFFLFVYIDLMKFFVKKIVYINFSMFLIICKNFIVVFFVFNGNIILGIIFCFIFGVMIFCYYFIK